MVVPHSGTSRFNFLYSTVMMRRKFLAVAGSAVNMSPEPCPNGLAYQYGGVAPSPLPSMHSAWRLVIKDIIGQGTCIGVVTVSSHGSAQLVVYSGEGTNITGCG